ncbi:hypothetical protein [uncultured Ruegeria sp.]|uniref:hypothetical protein n=1 Tax=uncultured Ruegeria sp. TaxID=259304 RepID=UPI0026288B67|nr:hypothetical protein [uncultured Ruegeria sp.]
MRVWDYPFDTVQIDCETCGWFGKYSKKRFVELVGADTTLPDALRIVAKDCSREKSGLDLHNRCGAGYPDLSKLRDKT